MSPSAYPLITGSDVRRILHSERFLHSSFAQIYYNQTIYRRRECLIEESLLANPSDWTKGEAWFILSRKTAEFLYGDTLEKKQQDIVTEWMLKLGCFSAPDELFAQNAILDERTPPQIRDEIKNDHMYYIKWPRKRSPSSPRKHPYNLHDVNDFWESIQMSGSMFARKFMSPIDAKEMLDRIDSELHSNENHINRIISRMESACVVSQPDCSIPPQNLTDLWFW